MQESYSQVGAVYICMKNRVEEYAAEKMRRSAIKIIFERGRLACSQTPLFGEENGNWRSKDGQCVIMAYRGDQ